MRKSLALFLLLLIPASGLCQVNGHLEVIDHKPVLTVWGTHLERGYAQGYLMGENAKVLFDEYFVGFYCGGSAAAYAYLRSLYVSEYYVDPKYEDEATGMIQGMIDSGVDLYNATLGREVDVTDILMLHAIVDLSQRVGKGLLGCSSLSSWGAATAADPVLDGHLVITRHLDWSKHSSLTDNPALVVHFPAEADEQPWVSVIYAGFFGALSCVNESGLGAFLNMGNIATFSGGAPYHPILLTLRNGIEAADYDGDGSCTADDLAAAVADRSRSSGTIIHVTRDEGMASWPVVIEVNNSAGVVVRDPSHNTVIAGDNLAATNHFRLLYSPVYCYRYAAIADSLAANSELDRERSWWLMAGAAGSYTSNIQAIQYVPAKGLLYWALDTYTEPAYAQTPTVFDLSYLFGFVSGTGPVAALPSLEQNHPNPFNPATTIRFHLPEAGPAKLTIYGLTGRRVRTLLGESLPAGWHDVSWDGRDERGRPVASGAYVYRLEAADVVRARSLLLVR